MILGFGLVTPAVVFGALVGAMFRRAAALAKEHGYSERGYRTVFNCNREAGQTVFHIHLHLLADAPAVAREGYAANAAGAAIFVTGRVNRLLAWLVRTMPQGLVSAVNRRAAASYRHT